MIPARYTLCCLVVLALVAFTGCGSDARDVSAPAGLAAAGVEASGPDTPDLDLIDLATGTARLSGAVNLSRLGSHDEITFDCVFVIDLD